MRGGKNLRIAFLLFLFGIFSLFYLKTTGISAEEENPEDRARQDYLFQYANYSQAVLAYQTAKGGYEKFATIAAREEAIEKTKTVLMLRAEVLRTYLQLLKIKLIDLQDLEVGMRRSQVGKIEATQAFLETHKTNIGRTTSIAELNAESNRFERESLAMDDLSRESLAYVLIGQAQGLEARSRNLLEQYTGNLPETTATIEQGTSEVRLKLTSTRAGMDRATDKIMNYDKEKYGKAATAYKEVQAEIIKVKTMLKETAQLLKEIVGNLP